MAINIKFNNADYTVEESAIAGAKSLLKTHLTTVMNGSGASVKFDGTNYSLSSDKLNAAKDSFAAYLQSIVTTGAGTEIIMDGVKYNVNSSRLSTAISNMANALAGLSGGGSTEGDKWIVLTPEIELPFVYDEYYGGAYVSEIYPAPFGISIGNTYKIIWDGIEYICVAQNMDAYAPGAIGLGNLTAYGGEGNDEPFVIGYAQADGNAGFLLGAFDNNPTHTIGVAVKYNYAGDWFVLVNSTELQFAYNEFFDLYLNSDIEATFEIVPDKTYKIVWDGVEYICKAQDLKASGIYAVCLGNLIPFGGVGQGEPFIVAYMDDGILIGALDDGNSHTIELYVDKSDDLIFNTSLNFILDEDLGVYTSIVNADFELIGGKTYDVNWNGTLYQNISAYEILYQENYYTYIGNGAPYGFPGNNEPFILLDPVNSVDGTIKSFASLVPVDGPVEVSIQKVYTIAENIGREKIIIAPTVLQGMQQISDEKFNKNLIEMSSAIHFRCGKKYIVVLDGMEYECEAEEYWPDGEGEGKMFARFIGNGSLISNTFNDNLLPFCVYVTNLFNIHGIYTKSDYSGKEFALYTTAENMII